MIGKKNRSSKRYSDNGVERASSVGKKTLVASRYGASSAVQRTELGSGSDSDVQQTAADGVSGPAETLPHGDTIQQSFGSHDIGEIQAHVGGEAADAAQAIGARAYATGNQVAFAATPDLHTAAHEAAHVVQQRSGVALAGGVGQSGDPYERHADAVADTVVRGESAQELLGAASATAAVHRGGPVQRAEEESTAADAAAVAPAGALPDLRGKLAQVDVPEPDCLRLIGLLGPGERTLVTRDHAMMRQMAGAFDAAEMLTAVDRLDCELKWSLYWLNEAGEASNVDAAGYNRLIASADHNHLAALMGWDGAREILINNYHPSPLAMPTLQAQPDRMRHVIGLSAEFSDWVLRRDGAATYLHYAAHNAPVDVLVALRRADRLTTMLDGVAAAGMAPQIAQDLKALFIATTVVAEKQRLFRMRWGGPASDDFDWAANGERHWSEREQVAGEGQSDEQIATDIAAGNGPVDVDAAVAASPDGSLQQLRDALDDMDVPEAACLGHMRQLNARERYLVRHDQTLMGQICGAFDGGEMMSAVGLLAFPEPKDAIFWIDRAGEAGSIGRQGYEGILFNATSQGIANLVGWRAVYDVVHASSGLDPLAIAPLTRDDMKFAHVLGHQSHYVDWILQSSGAQAFIRYLAVHTPATTAPALSTGGKLNSTVDALPVGSALAPDDKAALFELHKHLTIAEALKLFGKRFNVNTGTEGGGAFEADGLQRMWELLERMPEAAVASNDWLEQVNRRSNPTAPSPQGVAGPSGGTNRLAVGYDPAQLDRIEAGAFTDPGDVMRGGTMFNDTVIHELAHAWDNQYDFSGDGGPLATRADLGAWRQYRNSSDAEAQALLDDMKAQAAYTGLDATQTTDADQAFLSAIRNQDQNARDAFQRLGTAAGEAWSAGTTWFDLWSALSGHSLVTALSEGHLNNSAWNNLPTALGTRFFHQAYGNRWASYLAAFRSGGQKLSRYQFRTRGEFFSEIAAVYYSTPDNPGQTVQAWNAVVYGWFTRDVDRGYSTQVTP